MGLDMYLNKVTFIGAQYEHRDIKGTISLTTHGENIPIKFERVAKIIEQVMYWRKANAIHAWFVKNVQDGNDDCGEHHCTVAKLKELLYTVNEVLAHHEKAGELLPSQSGFFFGGTEYDEYYFQDLEDTSKALLPLLENEGVVDSIMAETWFEYHSSW